MEKNFVRILDTNLNRCKEGLRVIEDTCRFVFNDENLYKEIRNEMSDIYQVNIW